MGHADAILQYVRANEVRSEVKETALSYASEIEDRRPELAERIRDSFASQLIRIEEKLDRLGKV